MLTKFSSVSAFLAAVHSYCKLPEEQGEGGRNLETVYKACLSVIETGKGDFVIEVFFCRPMITGTKGTLGDETPQNIITAAQHKINFILSFSYRFSGNDSHL